MNNQSTANPYQSPQATSTRRAVERLIATKSALIMSSVAGCIAMAVLLADHPSLVSLVFFPLFGVPLLFWFASKRHIVPALLMASCHIVWLLEVVTMIKFFNE